MQPLDILFTASAATASSARKLLKQYLSDNNVPFTARTEDLLVAVGEAATNAFVHGGLKDGRESVIRFHAVLLGDCVIVKVGDQGNGYCENEPLPGFSIENEHGRGKQLMSMFCDSVHTCKCSQRFCVVLMKRLKKYWPSVAGTAP